MRLKFLLITAAFMTGLINVAQAYNIYLDKSGDISPLVKVEVYYTGGMNNLVRIARYQNIPGFALGDGKIGSWNWKSVKTKLGQKFEKHERALAEITYNDKRVPGSIPFEVSGFVRVTPISDLKLRVTCYKLISEEKGNEKYDISFQSEYNL